MAKFEKNKEGDYDKEEREEILRARDIIPPFNTKRSDSEKKALGAENQHDAIPTFELAEEIMAEHRKLTSTKRKSPAIEPLRGTDNKERENNISSWDITETPEMDKIITEIVARDIERLCR